VIVHEPAVAVVSAIVGGVVIVGDSPECVKVVFIMQVEDSSSVIDRRVIKFCVVLREFLVREVNVKRKLIL
jgi:hypothetical protein